MRTFSMISANPNRTPATAARAAFAVAALLAAAPAAFAQSADDDLYGVPGAATTDAPETRPTESPNDAETPSGTPSTPAPDTSVATPVDTAPPAPAPAPRVRVTRETTINPLDTRRGNYRNPKKALFMSLVVPGLGQAYVGQSAFTYARAAVYFGTEVTLGAMWYQYSSVKYDRETKRYKRFANEHWSQGAYEQRVYDEQGSASSVEAYSAINPQRTRYCEAVQDRTTATGQQLYQGCTNVLTLTGEGTPQETAYLNFKNAYDDRGLSPDAVAGLREGFSNPVEFYTAIGKYQEFVAGWDDATGVAYSDAGIAGTSANRDAYNAMRAKARDYSRMQAWFIGGLVLNHITSAVDAALTARHHNRVLYEGEARWYDRMNLDGGLAFDRGRPMTHLTARLSF